METGFQQRDRARTESEYQIWMGTQDGRSDVSVADVVLSCWRMVKMGLLTAVRFLDADDYESVEVHYDGDLGREIFLAHELGVAS